MNSSQYLLETSREYALYVCSQRAIPNVTDGLKHVQRMALWLLRNKAEKIKVIALSGELAAAKLYVHGDASSNNAISMLAAPYCNNIPLIEPHGSFGSRLDVTAFGAARYVSVARSKAAQAFLYKDLDIVPMEDNYDGSNRQPVHFLPLIPTVLLNGVSGIAVGWSTNILPRSLKSLIDATRQALLGEPIRPVAPSYARFDIGVSQLGPNQWEFTGRATIVDTSTVRITELPPGLSVEAFRKRLIEMEDSEQIQGFTDRSTETIDITVKMKRGSIAGWTEKDAIEFFKIRERVTERIVVIDWNGKAIRTYDSAETLIADFVTWRLRWYTQRFEFLKQRDLYELTYWVALRALFDDNFPKKLGGFTDRATLEDAVRKSVAKKAKEITLDQPQMDRIVTLPTYKWTKEFAAEVDARIADLGTAIAGHEMILRSPDKLRGTYLSELEELKGMKF